MEELLSRYPDNFMANYNLGNWLIEKGNLSEAAEHFRLALLKVPGHVKSHLSLGFIALRLGDNQTALDHLLSCLKLEPNHPQSEKIRKTIEILKANR